MDFGVSLAFTTRMIAAILLTTFLAFYALLYANAIYLRRLQSAVQELL